MADHSQPRIRTPSPSIPLMPYPVTQPPSSPALARRKGKQPEQDFDPREGVTRCTVNIPDQVNRKRAQIAEKEWRGDLDVEEAVVVSPVGPRTEALWWTNEFKVYYLVFLVGIPLLCWVPIRLSSANHRNFDTFSWRLSKGWLFGRQMDISDAQYRQFRSNIPSLLLLATAHLISSHLFRFLLPYLPVRSHTRARIISLAVFNTLLLFVLHGANAVKILLIFLANWMVIKKVRVGKMVILAVWAVNVVVLFGNEWFDGFPYGWMWGRLAFLDAYHGLLPRWYVTYNITMLRLISYGMDAHWSITTPVRPAGTNSSPSTHRTRVTTSLEIEEYDLLGLVAYAAYPPLYVAGPIMTYNDFIWQMKNPRPLPWRRILTYGMRFIFCLLTMEVILHSMYVVAIKDEGQRAWAGDSPADLSLIGFWNLIIVWLKLLIPWRFFRLWALMDGLDPPENMIRCMANNYSTVGFWRSWHRSYNLWTVRYIYVPLGGSNNVIVATATVFSFVALWHDLSFRLLAWGWLVSVFILPELAFKRLLPERKFPNAEWYRHIAAIGGACNVLLMMTANLVGFVIGLDGTKYLLTELVSSWKGIRFFVGAFICIFVTVHLMFEYREAEARLGIERKC